MTTDTTTQVPTIANYLSVYQQTNAANAQTEAAARSQLQAELLAEFETNVRAWLGPALPLFELGTFAIEQHGMNHTLSVPVRVADWNTEIKTEVYSDKSGRFSAKLEICHWLRLEMRTDSVRTDGHNYRTVIRPLQAYELGEFFARLEKYKREEAARERERQYNQARNQIRHSRDESEIRNWIKTTSAQFPEYAAPAREWAERGLTTLHEILEREAAEEQEQKDNEAKLESAREQAARAWFPFRVYRINYVAVPDGCGEDEDTEPYTEFFYSPVPEPSADRWWSKLARGQIIRSRLARLLCVEEIKITKTSSDVARSLCTVETVWANGHHVDILTPPPGVERLD
jgi:hypothetical protein